ncbi:MAG: hypothetical protein RL102_564 [Actinomycetota bacterium]|jgi:subtilisin family serine protease
MGVFALEGSFAVSNVKRVLGSGWGRVAIVLSIAIAMLVGAMPANAVVSISRTNYIVKVAPGTDAAVRATLASMGDVPTDEIDFVFDGFIVKLSDSEAAALRLDKNVLEVLADAPISLLDTEANPPSWGLDRVDQVNLPLDNTFTSPNQGGAGVRAYIVDTGVQADNPDFAGRILPGFDVIGTQQQNTDCQGHGTHVAGTVAGTRYGLAKKASIVPVRVLNCSGSGSFSGIITALDWIKANHPAGTPGVINMSIGGGYNQPVNDAVNSLVAYGLTAAIAAGNSNADACNASPASAASAITVGATDSSDARAYYSNWGACVDIFAPGSNIVSDDAFASGSSSVKSGTSMASPHVAGAAALALGQHPTWTPAQVLAALQENDINGKLTNTLSTNDGLLNITFLNAANSVPTPIVGVPDAPTALKVASITQSSASVSWTAPTADGGSPITGYKISYRDSAVTAWTTVDAPATATSLNLANLESLTTYQVQAVATNSVGDSLASAGTSFTTIGDLPGAPTNFKVALDHGDYVDLTWTAPTNGGNTITSYTVQQLKNGAWVNVYSNSNRAATRVSGLTPLTAYSFKVFANNIAGSGTATPLDYTTGPLAPNAPAVVVSDINGKGATITWAPVASNDPSVPVVYELTYGYSYTTTPIKTIRPATSGYKITNLYPLMASWVRVQAFAGTSASSAAYYRFTTTADVPTTPYWNSTTKSATDFTLNWAVSSSGGSAILDYVVQSSTSNTSTSVWADYARPTTTSLNVPIPAAGQTLYFRVAARNAVGLSLYSTVASVSGPVTAATAPQNLTVAAGTNNVGVNLTWDAPASNGGGYISSYSIRYSTNGGNSWTTGATVSAGSKTTGITYNLRISLGKGQTALFAVAANNSAGISPWSASVSYSLAKTVPSASSGMRVTTDNTGRFTLNWTAPTDNGGAAVTKYLLQSRASDGTWSTIAESPTNSLVTNIGGSGTTVTLRIVAVNEVGEGAPSSSFTVAVPFQKASAPQNLAGTVNQTLNRVELTWAAPADLFGGSVLGYMIQISTNNGTSWVSYIQVPGTAVAVNLPLMPKGSTYQYRVYANTQGGAGTASAPLTLTREASVPGAPTARSITLASGKIPTIVWNAPYDNGGSAVTGYVIEFNGANGWAEIARVAGNVLNYTDAEKAPGISLQYRVRAINATGVGAASSILAVTAPLLKPAAPTAVAVSDTATAGRLTVTWTASADLGGAPVARYYAVEISTNGGTSWSSYSAAANATSYVLNKPGKGVTYTIRVVTITGFGRSDASNSVTYSVTATAPSAPTGARVTFGADGNPIFSWYAPSDIGGSPLTAYIVELGTATNVASNVITWAAPITVAGSVRSVTGVRAAPGVYQSVRVTAVNALGNSPVSGVGSIMVPLLKPAAPGSFAGSQKTAGSTNVTLTWTAPTELGGSATAYYTLERSFNNGATWSAYTTLSFSSTTAVVAGPVKGTSVMFRMATRTGYGLSDYTPAITINSAATVPSYPSLTSVVLSTDGSNMVTLTWRAPSDGGGSAITGYRVDRVESGSTAVATVATTDAATLTARIPFSAPGVTATFRVYAINAIGVSASASVYSIRMPYAAPGSTSAPVVTTSSNSTTGSPRITVSWSAATSFGGSTLYYYQLQQSLDGQTWSPVVSTSGTSWTLSKPATGTQVYYRVVTNSRANLSTPSAVTQITF